MIFRTQGATPHTTLLEDVERAQRQAEARANATMRRLETLEERQAWLEAQRQAVRDQQRYEQGREPT